MPEPINTMPEPVRAATMATSPDPRPVPPDRVARAQRPSIGPSGHPRAGPQGHRGPGYRRNPAARALVTRRSQTIGVLSFDTTLYGPASHARRHRARRTAAGYFVSVADRQGVNGETVRDALERLIAQSVEGIISSRRCLGTVEVLPPPSRSLPS